MLPQALTHIRHLTAWLEAHQDSLVIDADTHATDIEKYPRRDTPHYYHGRPLSAEELVAEMDMAGVSMANAWQNPASTFYSDDLDKNAEVLLEANRYVFEAGQRYPHRFIPSGWADPKACGVDNACRIAEVCVKELGFALVKMNPAQNAYPIDSPAVLQVLDRIVELGAIPVFHYGADTPYTPASGLEEVALRHPGHPVVAVHMGGGGAGYLEAEELYHQSRELGLRLPNVHYIFSALRDAHIEEALISYQQTGEPFTNNLFCGSDAPYGRMTWNFGGFRMMFRSLVEARNYPDPRVRPGLFQEADVQRYMGGNFAKLVLDGYRRLLQIHQAVTV